MRLLIASSLAVCLLLSSIVIADQDLCLASYANGVTPMIVNEKLRAKTEEICYQGYAVLFSGVTRTPLWSGEHLTQARISQACLMKRTNTFHADPNLPTDIRSELDDYKYSGYDRGHMAPSGDMRTPEAQYESFSLANMTPQLHASNAGIWERLENGTRNLAYSGHDVYVVSGPLFEGATLKQLKGRVMVPTGFYKAVYDATANQAGVFVTRNNSEQTYSMLSVDELSARAGIDVFPTLPAEVKLDKTQIITAIKRADCKYYD